MGLRNQVDAALVWPEAGGKVADGKGGNGPRFGAFTRPIFRGGDCRATLWKASKDSVTTGLLEKLSISVRLFDSMSVERRERCDVLSSSIGRLRRCRLPCVGGRVSDRLR